MLEQAAEVQLICPTCHQRIEVISDVVVLDIKGAAFEGGIGYWSYLGRTPTSRRDEDLNYIGDYLIEEFDEAGVVTETHVLTDDLLRKGILARAASRGMSVERWYDEHDATEADCAVQLALFGDIRYG